MFKAKGPALSPATDYTGALRETSFYKYGHLRSLGPGGELTALAVDPLLSLLAVGTSSGSIHVFGGQSFQFTLPITPPGVRASVGGAGAGVKFLVFHPGHNRLVAIDDNNTIHSFALGQISDAPNPNVEPPLPMREALHPLFANVTAVEQPLPSYTHMFLAMQDGTLLAWDLRQKGLSTYRVDNLWAVHEERLVRSGVPGAHKSIGGLKATSLAINPRDLNILLIGYDGGVVAWDFQKTAAARTFELVLPPGAPGGGSYLDKSLWTERRPTVTSVVWHPDGNIFAVGHSDGCIAFWAFEDSDKPLIVRTLTQEDVNVTDAEALMSAGVLDGKLRSAKLAENSTHDVEGMPVLQDQAAANCNREPIFKLAWASFPDAVQLKTIATQDGVPLTNATAEYSERGETLLVVLGGQAENEKPGINMLQFPAYKPPLVAQGARKPGSMPTEGVTAVVRASYRDSLSQTGASNYPTKTPPEDFTLLPRSSPYFGMAHDPIAILILLTADPRLPVPSAATAERQLESFVFPPPRSSGSSVLGRKNYGLGTEDIIAMTPAPHRDNGSTMQRVSSNTSSGWRMPWSSGAPSPSSAASLSVPSLVSPSSSSFRSSQLRLRHRIPSLLWSGGQAVLGCCIIPLPTPTFKRLIARTMETISSDTARVPLRGGLAVPDLQTPGGPDVKVVKMENYRVLATWHADATVRFWDISPHLLVLPTPLHFEYPAPLPHLTISVGKYLRHPDVAHLPLAKLWANDRTKVRIAGVYLARETLECVITLVTGEVVVTKFSEAKDTPITPQTPNFGDDNEDEAGEGPLPSPGEGYFPLVSPLDGWEEEVTEIDHLAKWNDDGFKPLVICTVRRGEVVACSVSDIGFIAIAFAEHSLAVLDMRGPDVILREGFNEDGKTMKKRKRKGNSQNYPAESSIVSSMKWVISGIGGDPTHRPRLIVSYEKGTTKIYSLTNDPLFSEWTVDPKPPTFSNESLAFPLATFVLDPATGNELRASPEALADVLDFGKAPEGKWKSEAAPHALWIAASKKAIRVAVNFNGERIAKAEFEEELSDVHYITRHGHRVIVALTTTGSALFYTAPHLEYITRMDLFFGGNPRPLGKLSFDDRSGDFIEYNGPLDIALRTMFHFRKPYPPRIDPCFLKTPVPSQPQRLNASYFGWMWGTVLSGSALDSLIGGVHRPQAPKAPPPPKKPLITWGDPPKPEPVVPKAPEPKATKFQPRKAKAPVVDARERRDVYSELQDTLNQRGELMFTLGDSIDNAANAATKFFSQAGKVAVKEGAKATGKGFMGKLF